MQQYSFDEAQHELSKLIEAAIRGETVLIVREDQQVVQLVPVPVSVEKKPRKAGSARGRITMADDFDAPLSDFAFYTE